jgi:hypothetical protein
MSGLDLLLVSPGGRDKVYQVLGGDVAAIEPPLWTRLIAGYLLDRGLPRSWMGLGLRWRPWWCLDTNPRPPRS